MGILSPFKAAGRGLNGILNLGTQNALGAIGGDLNQVNPQDRAALRSNFLMSLGRGIQTGDIGGNIQQFQQGQAAPLLDFRAKQAEAAKVAQEQEALKQQQAALQQQRQAILADPSLAPEAKYQALAQIEAGLGNLGGAKQAVDIAGSFQAAKPEIVDPNKLATVKGPDGKDVAGFYTEDGGFIEANRQPVPGTDIEIITTPTGEMRAVDKAQLKSGEVIAEAAEKARRLTLMKSGDKNLIVDLDAGTSAPLIDSATGKPVRDPAPAADPYERFQNTSNLRKEFAGVVGDAVVVARQYRKIQSAASDPSPAGDIAILSSYMRMIDPGSTVREGEFATAENAAGVPEKIRNTWNKLLSGTRLGDAGSPTREDFLSQARNLAGSMRDEVQRDIGRFNSYAKRFGIAPEAVTFDPLEGTSAGVSDDEFNSLFK